MTEERIPFTILKPADLTPEATISRIKRLSEIYPYREGKTKTPEEFLEDLKNEYTKEKYRTMRFIEEYGTQADRDAYDRDSDDEDNTPIGRVVWT